MILNQKFFRILNNFGLETYESIEEFSPDSVRLVKELNIKNWSRELLVLIFLRAFTANRTSNLEILRVAVVGGGKDEPEVLALKHSGLQMDVHVFGVENDSNYLDLNLANSSHIEKFDLVLCSQVIEHVWNLDQAFLNLLELTTQKGLIWISCPMSNRFHGSPEFFSAGYSSLFLVRHITKLKLREIESGYFGSHRNYVATHLLNIWLSPKAHRNPFIHSFDSKAMALRIVMTFRFAFRTLFLMALSPRATKNPRFATESWILAEK